MYEIRKGVPIPGRYAKPNCVPGCSRFPFDKMSAGDSFEFPDIELKAVRSACSYFGELNDVGFALRKVSPGVHGCWMLAERSVRKPRAVSEAQAINVGA